MDESAAEALSQWKFSPATRNGQPTAVRLNVEINLGTSLGIAGLRHKYWHFVDKPFSKDGTTHFPELPIPNAQTQIDAFRAVLASNADDALKSYDLVWLLHLVGDVHQPLHASSRVSRAAPMETMAAMKRKCVPFHRHPVMRDSTISGTGPLNLMTWVMTWLKPCQSGQPSRIRILPPPTIS